jgi:hypothetical protein
MRGREHSNKFLLRRRIWESRLAFAVKADKNSEEYKAKKLVGISL